MTSQKPEARSRKEAFTYSRLWLLLAPIAFWLLASGFRLPQTRPTNQTIDQMIEALGGQAFLDVRDIHATGRFFGFTRGELSAADAFADYIKFPDMERTEFGGLKNKSITINRGK